MSTRNHSTITCPKCGHQQEFGTWPSLNVDLDPDQKNRLLSGELMRFTCEGCRASSEAIYPLLYHDMTGKLMIHFTAGRRADEHSNPLFDKLMTDYQLRVVATRNELVEKVWISTADLDDRVVEFFKITMEQQMEPETDGELLFVGMTRDVDEEEMLNFAWVAADGSESYMVPKSSFLEFENTISAAMRLQPAKTGEWLTIDREYAVAAFKAHFSEDSEG